MDTLQPKPSTGPSAAHKWWKVLVNRNPFYLLSVAFVFHGSSMWFQSATDHNPWMLMGLVGGFVVMMAATALALVRLGQVWDDARSILVLIPILFVELAMAFDDTLVADRGTGAVLILCGYALAAGIFELLLRGMRVSLGWLFRGPLHAMLALLFLYPLCFSHAIARSAQTDLRWWLFAFCALVAVSVLCLVPAVRRGREYVAANGTPWAWPTFPWALVFVLVGGLCVRAYAMCASFDPATSQSYAEAMKLQTIFGGYFAVPLVLAIGVVCLEAGKAGRHAGLLTTAVLLPMFALWLSVPGRSPSVPQAEFLASFLETAGSPILVSLILATVFYAYASMRRVSGAGLGLTLCTLGLSVVGRSTLDPETLTNPQFVPLICIAIGHVAIGYRRRSVLQIIGGGLVAVTLAHQAVTPLTGLAPVVAVEAHTLLICLIAAAIVSRGLLWEVAAAAAVIVLLALAIWSDTSPAFEITTTSRLIYAGILTMAMAAIAVRYRIMLFYAASGCGLAMLVLTGADQLWPLLRDVRGWRGLVFYGVGVLWFSIAVGISILKARSQRGRAP